MNQLDGIGRIWLVSSKTWKLARQVKDETNETKNFILRAPLKNVSTYFPLKYIEILLLFFKNNFPISSEKIDFCPF